MASKLPYHQAISMEDKFWGRELTGFAPDVRIRRQRAEPPQNLWDDQDVEQLTRGTYKDRLLHPSPLRGLQILELGCGSGWIALELARQGHRVDAYDISNAAIEWAKSYYQKIREQEEGLGLINYQVRDLNKIDLFIDTYHFVVCWDSLHHILESRRLIHQTHQSLIHGGKFLAFEHIPQKSSTVIRINATIGKIIDIVAPQAQVPRSEVSIPDEDRLYSPFEDVTGREMTNYFIEAFGKQHVVIETTLAFGTSWLAKIRGPRRLRLGTVALAKKIDDYLIRKGIVEGEYLYIEGTKS